MTHSTDSPLPPGQQLVAPRQWPTVGERAPRCDDSPWIVHVAGAVLQPSTFTLDALESFAQVERIVDIHCVTRWSKPQVRFRGVPLAVLIRAAEPETQARFVSFVARSDRNHSTSLPLADALALDALVALSVEGLPLPVERGGPVRVVVPGRYFYKSLKWLERIELVADDRLGFWESTAGYHNTADPWRQQRYIAAGLTKAQAREILSGRDISGRDLRSLQAAGLDLSGLKAENALLRDADFRGCDLCHAVFDGANLTNAHFDGAQLRGASFRAADLEGASLCGADLRGACLLGARLLAASFCDSSAGVVTGGALVDADTQVDPVALLDLTPEQATFVRTVVTLKT